MRTTSEIEARAKDILNEHLGDISSLSLPVNLDAIVLGEGLTLIVGKFENPEIAGAYSKRDKKIYVAEDTYYPRMAFTIAHELGHFILHKDFDEEVFLRLDSDNLVTRNDDLEVEANRFAAALLMPSELVSKYWSIGGVDDIATVFGVSRSAATWRLKNLGLLQ